jgi:hypothetical protein
MTRIEAYNRYKSMCELSRIPLERHWNSHGSTAEWFDTQTIALADAREDKRFRRNFTKAAKAAARAARQRAKAAVEIDELPMKMKVQRSHECVTEEIMYNRIRQLIIDAAQYRNLQLSKVGVWRVPPIELQNTDRIVYF